MKLSRTLLVVVSTFILLGPALAAQAGTPAPTIRLSKTHGHVGAPVAVHGSGFRHSAPIAIKFRGPAGLIQVASTRSHKDGTISVSFHAPAVPAGAHPVFAVDALHHRSTVVWFRIDPRLRLSPTRTAPADTICVQTGIQTVNDYTVHFSLSGYPAHTPVTITLVPRLGGPAVRAYVVTTGPLGSAWGTYRQPHVASGNYLASTSAGGTKFGTTVKVFSAWFTCYAFSGHVHPMRWRADGVGFLPGSQVSVSWGGSHANPVFTATVRPDGTWGGAIFTVACAPHPGTYTVTTTGTDGQGRPILAKSRNHIRTACG